MLPVTAVSPTRQIAGGAFLVALGAATALFLLVTLNVQVVVGIVVGIGLYLAVRRPIRRTGMLSGGTVAVDRDGIVRALAGLPAITRASRQFTNPRHFAREVWSGVGIVAAYVVACIVLTITGVGLVSVGILCALLGTAMAEGGLAVARVGRARQATGATMLDGIPMVVLLAAYLHLSGRLDEIEAGLPAEALIERLATAEDHTMLTARKFINAWSRLQQQVTQGGSDLPVR